MSLGDLGYTDAENFLFLCDRRTDLIVRGGANIYPAEVEAALMEHPAVLDAVVVGIPSEEYGARVHAIVQVAEIPRSDEMKSFMRICLASYKCPETYEFVHAALRDEAGKVRRSAFREQGANSLSISHATVEGLEPLPPSENL